MTLLFLPYSLLSCSERLLCFMLSYTSHRLTTLLYLLIPFTISSLSVSSFRVIVFRHCKGGRKSKDALEA